MKQASYLILSILIITSCAYSSQRPDVVDRSIAQKAQSVTFATVVDIDKVVIAGDADVGATAGAVIGAAAGQSVSDSDIESGIGGILGGLVGSAVGSAIGDRATQKLAIELLLELDNGKTISIIQQESQYEFLVGQRVKIIKSSGISRVLPLE
jgi:outer membrane lipoprotein SlyB